MVQQVQSIESGIPTALEQYYTGLDKEGKPIGTGQGLLPLAYQAYFPQVQTGVDAAGKPIYEKQFGPQAYQTIFKPVQEAGLLGAQPER